MYLQKKPAPGRNIQVESTSGEKRYLPIDEAYWLLRTDNYLHVTHIHFRLHSIIIEAGNETMGDKYFGYAIPECPNCGQRVVGVAPGELHCSSVDSRDRVLYPTCAVDQDGTPLSPEQQIKALEEVSVKLGELQTRDRQDSPLTPYLFGV